MSYRVDIKLKNNEPYDVVCVIPQGHVFENKQIGTGRQNVAAVRQYTLVIPAGSTISVGIDAYCMNASYSPPSGPGNVSIFKINKPFQSQQELWQLMANSTQPSQS